jgi:hypothetical protein
LLDIWCNGLDEAILCAQVNEHVNKLNDVVPSTQIPTIEGMWTRKPLILVIFLSDKVNVRLVLFPILNGSTEVDQENFVVATLLLSLWVFGQQKVVHLDVTVNVPQSMECLEAINAAEGTPEQVFGRHESCHAGNLIQCRTKSFEGDEDFEFCAMNIAPVNHHTKPYISYRPKFFKQTHFSYSY